MSMFIYKGGGGVKNGQNLVYVVKVWPLKTKAKQNLMNDLIWRKNTFNEYIRKIILAIHKSYQTSN